MRKTYILPKLLACACATLLATACNDAWDEHYAVDPTLNSDKTLWEMIEDDPELQGFEQILKDNGYDELLKSGRYYTVWAPVGETFTDCPDDNIVGKFIENHIANYRHVATGTLTENNGVHMLNGKRLIFKGSKGGYTFNKVNLVEGKYNMPAKNGMLHKIGGNGEYSTYSSNIWEYLGENPKLSLFNEYMKSHTDSTINQSLSVQGGVNEFGEVEYVDIVYSVSNPWWNRIGQLNNEDSTYILIAPTDEAWKDMYKKAESYFKYDNRAANEDPDSLQKLMTEEYMCRHLAFSKTVQKNDDELISNYNIWASGKHVTFSGKEKDDLFAGEEKVVELSNGTVHVVNQLNYSPLTCWLDTITIEGENTYYCWEINNKDKLTDDNIDYNVVTVSQDSSYYENISEHRYMIAQERGTKTNVQITYTIPSVYAAKYRVKVVVVPAVIQNPELVDLKPNPLKMKFSFPKEDGVGMTDVWTAEYKYTDYNYQKIDTLIFKATNGDEFVTIPHCEYGVAEPKTQLAIYSNYSSRADALDRTLRIDCIILEPIE